VGLTSISRAINLLLKEKAESLINKNREIKGGNLRIPVPSVIRLKYYIKPVFREAYPIICDSFLNPANPLIRREIPEEWKGFLYFSF